MASQTMDDASSTAQDLESLDFGIIDDQAIDREIASAYNLPTEEMEVSTEDQPLPAFEYNRESGDGRGDCREDCRGDCCEGCGDFCGDCHGDSRGDSHGDCRRDYRGDCRGDYRGSYRGPAYSHENLEMSQLLPDYREYSPSIDQQHHSRERGRLPISNMSRSPDMHTYQSNRPIYQRSQRFDDHRHFAYENEEYGHPEGSEYLSYDHHSPSFTDEYEESNGTVSPQSQKSSGRTATGTRRWERYNTNLIPPRVPTETVSNATLQKMGIARGKEDTIAIRGSGINDPENIRIVNLRDNEGLAWDEISDLLNKDRISRGAEPRFTPNNVHNRYNRNAPVLCAAEGVPFVPIRERKKRKVVQRQKSKAANWSNDLDELLVKTHMEVKGWFWEQVCTRFEESGGFRITPTQAANRMKLI